jgi:hypothetical protein
MTRTGRAAAKRREELRRVLPRRSADLRTLVHQPEFITSASVIGAFLLVISLLVISARERIKVDDGMVMTTTRLKRLDYKVPDGARTDEDRRTARERAPEVYRLNRASLEALRTPLLNLPVVVSGQPDVAAVDEPTRKAYELDEPSIAALAPHAVSGAPGADWRGFVHRLVGEVLPRYPVVFEEEWSIGMLRPELPQLRGPDDRIMGDWREAIRPKGNLDEQQLRQALVEELIPKAREAGFPSSVARYVAAGLASKLKIPTYALDAAATEELATQRAREVATTFVEHRKGEALYRRGDLLTPRQKQELEVEAAQFGELGPPLERWLPRLGALGFTTVVASFIVGYVVLFYPRITRNPMRLLAICVLMALMLGLTAHVGVAAPAVAYLGAVAPTIFVAVLMLLAYDQRIALFMGATQAALATFVLEQSIGMYVLLFCGCGLAVAQLREVRHRSNLIRATGLTGLVLAAGAFMLGLVETPLVEGAWPQIRFQCFMSGLGAFGVGFVILGLLPTLERVFDMTTGMTLAELRDPRQSLLRQLQQKAPGTYNHSLQVANIAEAAAEAIGANGLLVYVGALYHDIGKMNKPEYFVENQADGVSKHAKLSPAMSLLVIVGHVKDGAELAREYGLPRSIQHFIESHHGTTLVEYFYHAARTRAEADERGTVDEVEYRYPGPKPRTKEAAIIMIADAVESATRSLAEPTPARIEGLVRTLSRKRLTDGQFDRCDLTFRELEQIEDATIKSLCAIYHSRISYPSQKQDAAEQSPKPVSA